MRIFLSSLIIALSLTTPVLAVDVMVTGGTSMQVRCSLNDGGSAAPSWFVTCYQNGTTSTCPAGTTYAWSGEKPDTDGAMETYRVSFDKDGSFAPSLYVNGTPVTCPASTYESNPQPQRLGNTSGGGGGFSRVDGPSINLAPTGSAQAAGQNTNQNTGQNNGQNISQSGAGQNTPTPQGIINCNTKWNGKSFDDPCNFNAAMKLLQIVIDWMFYIAVPISVIGILYAGYLYLFAFNKPDNIKTAHGLFKTVLIGFGIMFTAWILVTTLVKAVVDTEGNDTPVSQSDFRQFLKDF